MLASEFTGFSSLGFLWRENWRLDSRQIRRLESRSYIISVDGLRRARSTACFALKTEAK